MDFSDKVALITGGAGGIGRAAALGFAHVSRHQPRQSLQIAEVQQ